MPDQAVEEQAPQTLNEDSKTNVQSAQFPEADESSATGPKSNIDILLDMNIPVTVVIGKTEMPIQQLLQMGPGSVVQLSKPIDAPADLYLRDTKFATGSIVVVEEKFAVRIKEIISNAVSVVN
jgi:flagellar motor switch protein FliN/FliY